MQLEEQHHRQTVIPGEMLRLLWKFFGNRNEHRFRCFHSMIPKNCEARLPGTDPSQPTPIICKWISSHNHFDTNLQVLSRMGGWPWQILLCQVENIHLVESSLYEIPAENVSLFEWIFLLPQHNRPGRDAAEHVDFVLSI